MGILDKLLKDVALNDTVDLAEENSEGVPPNVVVLKSKLKYRPTGYITRCTEGGWWWDENPFGGEPPEKGWPLHSRVHDYEIIEHPYTGSLVKAKCAKYEKTWVTGVLLARDNHSKDWLAVECTGGFQYYVDPLTIKLVG